MAYRDEIATLGADHHFALDAVSAITPTTVAAGGTGYSVNDTLTCTGGTFTTAATFNVDTVNVDVVLTVSIINEGEYSVFPTNPVSTTGPGSGATLTLNPGILDLITGTLEGIEVGLIYTAAAIAEDALNVAQSNTLGDQIRLGDSNDINTAAHQRKAVCGFFRTSQFNPYPVRIYGEGLATTTFQFCSGYGNNLVFEVVEPTSFPLGLQIYGPALELGRIYHICGIFLGNTQGNEIKLFVDGVEIFNADPVDRQPDTADLNSRTEQGDFGVPQGTSGLGGDVVLQQAAVFGSYNHWAFWGDDADADLTDIEVREILVEQGALALETVSSDTEANMQIAIDALTVANPNALLNVEIEAVTGGGDFELTSDLTFDALASIHFRYNGTADTLTIVNVSGGDASIVAAPFGTGAINLATRQTLTVTCLDAISNAAISGARVYIEAAAGGDLSTGTVIMNTTTNGSGVATVTHDYTSDQPILARIRKGTTAPLYRTGAIGGPLTAIPLNETILLVEDD